MSKGSLVWITTHNAIVSRRFTFPAVTVANLHLCPCPTEASCGQLLGSQGHDIILFRGLRTVEVDHSLATTTLRGKKMNSKKSTDSDRASQTSQDSHTTIETVSPFIV